MNSKYRYLAPNSVTFISLICGVVSIFLSINGILRWAGVLILISYVLDLFDGALARRLNAGSEFGLQLDSLVDMVSLGMAPAALFFVHVQNKGLPAYLLWPLLVLVPMAGAFRLARFNLLPPKASGSTDSVGLTISTAGATLAITVLSDLIVEGEFLPQIFWLLIPLGISILQVSTIGFPSFAGVFGGRWRGAFFLSIIGVMLLIWPFMHTWFIFNSGYLGVSVARAGISLKDR